MRKATATLDPAPGEIRRDATYTLDEVRKRLGVSHKSIRTFREAGLPVRYVGRTAFVSGADFASFVDSLPTNRDATPGCEGN